ncbi:MAG: ATPase [Verrucomicrobia bacterium]|nr:ATPase [Verrucomicrobiota bacterium]
MLNALDPIRRRLERPLLFDGLAFALASVAAGLLLMEIGWDLDAAARASVIRSSFALAGLVLLLEVLRVVILRSERTSLWQKLLMTGIPALALAQMFVAEALFGETGGLALRGTGLLMLATSQLTLVASALLRLVRLTDRAWFRKASPGMLVVGSFVTVILIGTLLLKTPKATSGGITWIDSIFTSTSAVCVTGLIVRDTAVDFTFSGQAMILVLIQIGGLGVMTLAYFLALMSGQGISLRDRVFLNEMLSQNNVLMVGRFVLRIVLITLLLEALGAWILHLRWGGLGGGLWHSVFHSVSAFCNAGFSTFSSGLMDDAAREERVVQTVIMVLIVLGGLGFVTAGRVPGLVFAPLRRKLLETLGRRGPKVRVPVHVRLVLFTTGILLLGGALGFTWVDAADPWPAAFNSVTARTAGFNITEMADLSAAGVVLMCFLMVVGGSPGGTAGGLKTTTVALGVLEIRRIVLGRTDVNLWGRRVSRDVLDRCHATLVLSFQWIIASVVAVAALEPRLALDDVIFECVSAFSTVGLSRGITGDLGTASKLVIITTMLVGRIGILAFAISLGGRPRPRHFRYPEARLPLN